MVFERLAKPWGQKPLWVRFPVSPPLSPICQTSYNKALIVSREVCSVKAGSLLGKTMYGKSVNPFWKNVIMVVRRS